MSVLFQLLWFLLFNLSESNSFQSQQHFWFQWSGWKEEWWIASKNVWCNSQSFSQGKMAIKWHQKLWLLTKSDRVDIWKSQTHFWKAQTLLYQLPIRIRGASTIGYKTIGVKYWCLHLKTLGVALFSCVSVCTFKVIHGKWLLGMKSCQNIIETVSLMSVHISNAKGYGDDFFPLGLLLTRAFCDFTKLFSISSSNPISSSCC